MFADALLGTHSGSGGAGSLTLVAAKGCKLPSDLPGLSGSLTLPYQASEYTDSSQGTLLQYERGIATLNLSTLVLSSRVPSYTLSGGVITTNSPAALNFGNVAANFSIRFGDSALTQRPALPAVPSVGGNEAYLPFNWRVAIDSLSSGSPLAAGRKCYIPCEYIHGKLITAVAVNATAVTTTGNVRVSLYEWGSDGMPGNLIKEFTSASQIGINTATGIKFLTLPTPFWIPPGFYFVMIQADAAVQILFVIPPTNQGLGVLGNRDVLWLYKDGVYGPAPVVGDNVSVQVWTRSGGNQPLVYVK